LAAENFNTVQHGNVPTSFSGRKLVFGSLFLFVSPDFRARFFGEGNQKFSADNSFAPTGLPTWSFKTSFSLAAAMMCVLICFNTSWQQVRRTWDLPIKSGEGITRQPKKNQRLGVAPFLTCFVKKKAHH